MENKIMSISIDRRIEEATNVQEVLTKSGSIIKTRLGLHDATGDANSNHGLLLLHLNGDSHEINCLHEKLDGIESVNVNMMDI